MTDPRRERSTAVRLVVRGTLRLVTPAHLGNGDAEGLTDMPLLVDARTGGPLLPGTSVAGALRGFLLSAERGYGVAEQTRAARGSEGRSAARPGGLAELLFGGVKGDADGEQSPLIVDDALGSLPEAHQIEVRDGVKIDYATRTAEDRKKYDLELLPAGTTFDLRLELLMRAEEGPALRAALARALAGLMPAEGEEAAPITIGARKARGFGRCRVDSWQVQEFNLREFDDLLAWVTAEHPDWAEQPPVLGGGLELIAGENAPTPGDGGRRREYVITARMALDGGMLIRSPEPLTASGKNQPDATHLRSWRDGELRPILPGTSLAGALRGRATRIVNTLLADNGGSATRATELLDELFGADMHGDLAGRAQPAEPTASRLIVEESRITGGAPLVQSRVAIDRFTGGAFATALFAEAPQVGGEMRLRLAVRCDERGEARRQKAFAGLALLLLKDLWTGSLPLGGTTAVGRGRLRGREALVETPEGGRWHIVASEAGGISVAEGEPEGLNTLVRALLEELA